MRKQSYFILFFLLIFARSYGEDVPASEPAVKAEEIKEEQVETLHTLTINGRTVPYKATAGTMLLKDEKKNSKAALFYIAYTKEGVEDISQRPITFCFNGGPGSSAVWLHLGVFGPKRVNLTEDGYSLPPYKLLNNEQSILDVTDLVFIDPVSTGYSRAVASEDPKQFHGVDEDVKSVAEFIRLYVTRNQRWGSPKFLAGESYGTTRAAGLAGYLHEQHRMYMNGVILISSILNYQTIIDDQRGNDLPYSLFLPSFTATAWYHNKLPQDLQERSLEDILSEVEDFTTNEYSSALFQGQKLSSEDREKIVQKLARYTGLSADYIKRANLRLDNVHFCKELLRGEERNVGRFDGRIKGIDVDPGDTCLSNDPSFDSIMGGFTAAFNQYVRGELKWEKEEPYKVLARDVWPWDFSKATNAYLNVSESLRDVMTRNSGLKVFIASGRYDLATPYFATDYTFSHLGLDPSLSDHVTMEYYDAGHMLYLHNPSLKKMKGDLAKFITETIKEQGDQR